MLSEQKRNVVFKFESSSAKMAFILKIIKERLNSVRAQDSPPYLIVLVTAHVSHAVQRDHLLKQEQGFSVITYYDEGRTADWVVKLRQHDVAVFTVKVLRQVLQNKSVNLHIDLLVIDECSHINKSHPMYSFMNDLKLNEANVKIVEICALTTDWKAKCMPIAELEHAMNCIGSSQVPDQDNPAIPSKWSAIPECLKSVDVKVVLKEFFMTPLINPPTYHGPHQVAILTAKHVSPQDQVVRLTREEIERVESFHRHTLNLVLGRSQSHFEDNGKMFWLVPLLPLPLPLPLPSVRSIDWQLLHALLKPIKPLDSMVLDSQRRHTSARALATSSPSDAVRNDYRDSLRTRGLEQPLEPLEAVPSRTIAITPGLTPPSLQLVPECSVCAPLEGFFRLLELVPCLLHKLERRLRLMDLVRQLDLDQAVLAVLQRSEEGPASARDRLQFVGGNFIRFHTSCSLFFRHPYFDEKELTKQRNRDVGTKLDVAGCGLSVPWAFCAAEYQPPGFQPPALPPISDRAPGRRFLQTFVGACLLSGGELAASRVLRMLLGGPSDDMLTVFEDERHKETAETAETTETTETRMDWKDWKDWKPVLVTTALGLGPGSSILDLDQHKKGDHALNNGLRYRGVDLENGPVFQSGSPFQLPSYPLPAEVAVSGLIDRLQRAIGYSFRTPALAVEALTHPSFPASQATTPSYQRLEFLGDAVLEFLVSDYLDRLLLTQSAGVLTLHRQKLVSNRALAECSRNLGLPELVLGAPGAFDAPGPEPPRAPNLIPDKVAADLLEALIGAIYVDSRKKLSICFAIFKSAAKVHFENLSFSEPNKNLK